MKDNRLTIAIDFDETIVQTMREIYRIADEPFDYNDLVDYSVPKLKFGNEKFYDLLYQAHQSKFLLPTKYALETIKGLTKEYNVFVLTSNSYKHIIHIKNWLANYDMVLPVIHTKSFEEKFNVQWDILIDDHPDLEMMGVMHNKLVILYPQPYNKAPKYQWFVIPTIIKSNLLVAK